MTRIVLIMIVLASTSVAQRRAHHGQMAQFFEVVKLACDRPEQAAASTFGRWLSIGPDGVDVQKLAALAQRMREGHALDRGLDDPSIPAGLVFLGQFIDHDITLDVLSQLGEVSDPTILTNFRSPELDLDSVYLGGPAVSPHLYDADRWGYFRYGSSANPLDLLRTDQGVALIGDPRNDENGIISQLHLLFLRFHNAVMAEVEYGRLTTGRRSAESDFDYARRMVTWHYQWIVRHQFLSSIVCEDAIKAIESGLAAQHERCMEAPLMPVEFSAAAYRFGHSQVRSSYRLTPGRPSVELFQPPSSSLSSFAPVLANDVVDWDFFFAVDGSTPQPSRRMDTLLAKELFELPFESEGNARSLAFRNLHRGANTFRLITGEDAAIELGLKPLPLHEAVKAVGLEKTPLWFYCLHEAERNGGKLGPVGGRIVSLTIMRLLQDDAESHVHEKGWAPIIAGGASFSMSHLIQFVRRIEQRLATPRRSQYRP